MSRIGFQIVPHSDRIRPALRCGTIPRRRRNPVRDFAAKRRGAGLRVPRNIPREGRGVDPGLPCLLADLPQYAVGSLNNARA